jgi:hypothetical protein
VHLIQPPHFKLRRGNLFQRACDPRILIGWAEMAPARPRERFDFIVQSSDQRADLFLLADSGMNSFQVHVYDCNTAATQISGQPIEQSQSLLEKIQKMVSVMFHGLCDLIQFRLRFVLICGWFVLNLINRTGRSQLSSAPSIPPEWTFFIPVGNRFNPGWYQVAHFCTRLLRRSLA